MRYEVMSRLDARQASRVKEAPVTAIISITDCGTELNKFHKANWLNAVLELQFDDVERGGRNCITPQNAVEIADFVLGVRKQVERFIVHCEFGQSRSAGVACIEEAWKNPGIFPIDKCRPTGRLLIYVVQRPP
jgi:predicted protein tyrosine phosphatase